MVVVAQICRCGGRIDFVPLEGRRWGFWRDGWEDEDEDCDVEVLGGDGGGSDVEAGCLFATDRRLKVDHTDDVILKFGIGCRGTCGWFLCLLFLRGGMEIRC